MARPVRRRFASLVTNPGPPTQVHLSWSEDPSRSLTVTWQTPRGRGPARVEFGPVDEERLRVVEAESFPSPGISGRLHRAVLGDLEPATAYRYRVSADSGCSPDYGPWWQTRTAPASPEARYEVAFVCDIGIQDRTDGSTAASNAVVRQLVDEAPLFVLGGGDYAYGNRDARFRDPADAIDRFFEQMEPLLARVPFMAQYGNHEVELAERYEDWAPRLAHPPGEDGGRSYSFDVGAAHFVGFYAPGRAPSETHLRWLREDLASERARRASWRIVFQHAPLVASGRCHPARPDVAALAPLFEELGVDLHLSGHDQSYERTHPIRAGKWAPPLPSTSATTSYAAGGGVIYAKISPGGKLSDRTGDFSRFESDAPCEVAYRNDDHHHWARLTVSNETLDLRVDGWSPGTGARETIEDVRLIARRSATPA